MWTYHIYEKSILLFCSSSCFRFGHYKQTINTVLPVFWHSCWVYIGVETLGRGMCFCYMLRFFKLYEGFFLPILTTLTTSRVFILATLVGVRWYLTLVLACISLAWLCGSLRYEVRTSNEGSHCKTMPAITFRGCRLSPYFRNTWFAEAGLKIRSQSGSSVLREHFIVHRPRHIPKQNASDNATLICSSTNNCRVLCMPGTVPDVKKYQCKIEYKLLSGSYFKVTRDTINKRYVK